MDGLAAVQGDIQLSHHSQEGEVILESPRAGTKAEAEARRISHAFEQRRHTSNSLSLESEGLIAQQVLMAQPGRIYRPIRLC